MEKKTSINKMRKLAMLEAALLLVVQNSGFSRVQSCYIATQGTGGS